MGVAGVLVFAIPARATEVKAPQLDPVWRWFAECPKPRPLRVSVQLDNKVLFEATVPTCHVQDSDLRRTWKQEMLSFKLRTSAARFGKQFRNLGTPEIAVDIWEAGGDAGDLILGVSFMTTGQVLLNGIHMAFPGKTSKSVYGEGITFTSSWGKAGN